MVDQVMADAPIVAGVGLALVHIIFTVHSLETCFALKQQEGTGVRGMRSSVVPTPETDIMCIL